MSLVRRYAELTNMEWHAMRPEDRQEITAIEKLIGCEAAVEINLLWHRGLSLDEIEAEFNRVRA